MVVLPEPVVPMMITIMAALCGETWRHESKKDWLGDLDSNQDSQIQSLESYQLDDLPAVENKQFSGGYLEERAVFSLTFHRWTPDLFDPIRTTVHGASLLPRLRHLRCDIGQKHPESCGH